MTAPDEALAEAARGGDRRAFEALVQRHKGPLYGLIRRWVGNPDDAYDVLQDAFAATWLALPRYDAKRSFAAWLRAIALNKCRDLGRRGAVRRAFLEAFAREQEVVTSPLEASPFGAEDDDARRLARLEREVARLPPGLKEPLILTAISGLSQQEAAQELGLSVKAVEMRVYRARRTLAARMGEGEVP